MGKLRIIRNVAFMGMLSVFLATITVRLNADPADVCQGYPECECQFDGWVWTASCDFSEAPDPEGRAQDFCNAACWECSITCNWPYEQHVISECLWSNPNPEVCTDDCIFTWDSCNCGPLGVYTELSCSCDHDNWCEW